MACNLVYSACKANNNSLVEHYLLGLGANPNEGTILGLMPLHWACYYSQLKTIKLLLAHGANANAQTVHGLSPLHIASYYARIESIDALLDAGADPNATYNGATPFGIYMRYGYHKPLIYKFLNAGADVNVHIYSCSLNPIALETRTPRLLDVKLCINGILDRINTISDLSLLVALLDAGSDPNASSALSLCIGSPQQCYPESLLTILCYGQNVPPIYGLYSLEIVYVFVYWLTVPRSLKFILQNHIRRSKVTISNKRLTKPDVPTLKCVRKLINTDSIDCSYFLGASQKPMKSLTSTNLLFRGS